MLAVETATAQGTATFSNTTSLTFPALPAGTHPQPATVYPSDVVVSGMSGVIVDVNVTLRGVSHTWGQDIDAMLVSPGGSNIVIMSDVAGTGGGNSPMVNRTFTFDDAGGAAMSTTVIPSSGVYRPSNSLGADAFPAPAPAQSAATSLTTFNGQAPNGTWSLYVSDDTAGDVGQMAGGWSITITTAAAPPATNAVFTAGPAGFNYAAAGICSLPGVRRIGQVTMTNSGTGGVVNVLGASVSGSSAFSIETVSPAPPTFPVALAPAATSIIGVAFQPAAGQTGPQNGMLELSYNLDGGPPQVLNLPLSGQGDAEGAGWLFRSSVADPACSSIPAPAAATFINPITAGHTPITVWSTGTADDGRFNVTLGTTPGATDFPSFRMFGIDHTNLQLFTNGIFAVGVTNMAASATGTSFATNTAVGNIAAMNLTFAATVAGDNTGVLGSPAMFWGTTDVDTDGDMEFVITWWHAHDVGSVPGPTAEYFTFQAILYQADEPNQEDYYEIRFYDGLDANGVPYRQNTNTTTGGDNSIENDAVTGIIEPLGQEQSLYRLRSGAANGAASVIFGGPLYSGGSVSVRFQAETQAIAQGQAGWRMLGVPNRTYFVNRLARLNLVQGVAGSATGGTSSQTFPGQYPTHAPNVFTAYDGTGWVVPSGTADILVPGQGFLWYLYDETFDPPDADGISNSYALPMSLQGTGAEPLLDLGSGSAGVTVHASGNGWNLLANPFRDDLDIANIASWARGGTLASAVAQIWNPNAGGSGSYVLSTAQGDDISAWQGFMIQNNVGAAGAVALSIPTPRQEGSPFVGRSQPGRLVTFSLSSTAADDGAALVDESAALYFVEDGADEWDLWDAGKLTPLGHRFATIAFLGERDGSAVIKAQDSRPRDITTFSVPMAVAAVGTTETMTVTWPRFDDVPENWTFLLRDLVTGTELDLRTTESYTFEVDPASPRQVSGSVPSLADAPASVTDARFLLVVSSGTTGSENGVPSAYALHPAAPNPLRGPSAIVRFDLPEAADASLEVFDMLGRRVATLAEGQREAGRHAARLDARDLSSGTYVVRMRAGDFVQAQRFTILR